MKRWARHSNTILLSITMISMAPHVLAQVATGVPQFSSSGGAFDVVNLGSLNVHFVIPVLHKAGRGLAFDYNLAYDSSIWQPVTSSGTTSWKNITDTNWGWTTSIPRGGHVGFKIVSSSTQYCYVGKIKEIETTLVYGSWTYWDGFGTPHTFPGNSTTTTNYNCTGKSNSTGFTAIASDRSGYTISVSGSTVTSLVAADGSVINPTTGATTLTDSNGNEITSSTSNNVTTYTDTLGTSAVAISGSGTPSSPITYTYTPPSGVSVAYTVKYTAYTVKTNFGISGVSEYGPTSNNLVSEIDLSDGSKYTFQYEATPGYAGDVTGRLASVTLPTGGTLTYTYSGGPSGTGIYSDGSTAGLNRILAASTTCNAANGCWQYSRSLVSGSPGPGSTWTTTVIDPNSNYTVINFAEDGTTNTSTTVATYAFFETERQGYQGSVSPSNLLATTIRCYNNNYASCSSAGVNSPISQTDVYGQLPNGGTRLSETIYNNYGLIKDDKEYDYGVATGAAPGTAHLVKESVISYASLGNGIVDRPASVTINDWTTGSATKLASTSYTYDGTAVVATSGTPQHTSVSGSRGNPTKIATQANNATTLNQQFTYYDTGNVDVATDVNNATATYTYGNCGNSFLTQTNFSPSGLSVSATWNCTGGVQLSTSDANGNPTTAAYSDPAFWRPASLSDPLGNTTTFTYQPNSSYSSPFMVASALAFGNSVVDDIQYKDTFGRTYTDQHCQSPSCPALDTVSYTYDNVGRPYTTSMPCATGYTGTCSGAQTTTSYDALSRPTQIQDGGGGTVSYQYNNNDVLQTIGPSQTFQKQFEYDGLGRLTAVCEITSGSGSGSCGQATTANGYLTKYTYDALGRLLMVTQNAQSSPTQTRSFAYDMINRLTSETNPENGPTTYIYDSNNSGGCTSSSAGDLVLVTKASGQAICYYYDSLHRLTDVGNNNEGAPNGINGCRRFRYDNSTGVLGNRPSGLVNTLGRVVEAETDDCTHYGTQALTDEWFGYDADGHETDFYESTPHSGGYYHTQATYWPNGLKSLSALNPSGSSIFPTIYYGASDGTGLDGEGRITKVTASSGTNPVSSVSYSPSTTGTALTGSLTGLSFPSGDSDSFTYDPNTGRELSYTFSVNGSTDKGTMTWNANGTLATFVITNNLPGATDSQTCNYYYDDLSRLGGRNGNGYSVDCGSSKLQQLFSFDSFGNISKSGTFNFLPTYNTATNHFAVSGVNVQYDADGNLLTDNLGTQYTWSVYGNPGSINTTNLVYDAQGQMVEQQNGSTYAQILYSRMGKTAIMNGQTLQKAFVPLPGNGTAIYNSSGLAYYRHADHLGSSRLTTTTARIPYSVTAYAPYGEQYATSGAADPSFTSQNSDTISTLYDFMFREHSPSQGRWISPDPAGLAAVDPANPQSWNRYAYVVNSPLGLTDPSGLGPQRRRAHPFMGDPGCNGGAWDIPYGLTGIQCINLNGEFLPLPLEFTDEFSVAFTPVFGWVYGYPDQLATADGRTGYYSWGSVTVGIVAQDWYWGVVGMVGLENPTQPSVNPTSDEINEAFCRENGGCPKQLQPAHPLTPEEIHNLWDAYCIIESLNENNSMGIPTEKPGTTDSVATGVSISQKMGTTPVRSTAWPRTSGSFVVNPGATASGAVMGPLAAPGISVQASWSGCMLRHGQ